MYDYGIRNHSGVARIAPPARDRGRGWRERPDRRARARGGAAHGATATPCGGGHRGEGPAGGEWGDGGTRDDPRGGRAAGGPPRRAHGGPVCPAPRVTGP